MRTNVTMEMIQKLASDFWLKTGQNPTHVIMTVPQQDEFSKTLEPLERIQLGTPTTSGKLTSIYLNNNCMLDVLPVVLSALRTGNKNALELPVVLRIEA